MPWEFVPEQKSVVVVPGETALAFFEAHNPTDEDIIGVVGVVGLHELFQRITLSNF